MSVVGQAEPFGNCGVLHRGNANVEDDCSGDQRYIQCFQTNTMHVFTAITTYYTQFLV
jgi:hypothetical protein